MVLSGTSYGIVEFRDEEIRTYIHRRKGCACSVPAVPFSVCKYDRPTLYLHTVDSAEKTIPRSVADQKSSVRAF